MKTRKDVEKKAGEIVANGIYDTKRKEIGAVLRDVVTKETRVVMFKDADRDEKQHEVRGELRSL